MTGIMYNRGEQERRYCDGQCSDIGLDILHYYYRARYLGHAMGNEKGVLQKVGRNGRIGASTKRRCV